MKFYPKNIQIASVNVHNGDFNVHNASVNDHNGDFNVHNASVKLDNASVMHYGGDVME